jgi:hypothetical protein
LHWHPFFVAFRTFVYQEIDEFQREKEPSGSEMGRRYFGGMERERSVGGIRRLVGVGGAMG